MESIIVALITGAFAFTGTFLSVYFANRKSTALIMYRIDELEKKVQKHNNLIERMYKIEENCRVLDEKMKVANHRIQDLEKGGKGQ
ncbi:MAG: hypothetical protein GX166_03390 [Clostridiaceae bacterium]|jgi:hypothetical protein|nr:hypothetical protein [Clostridiaceae bacterium]